MSRCDELRARHYNATLDSLEFKHADLAIFRVRPDGEPVRFKAGQYTTLGLGRWEPRLPDTQPESPASGDAETLIQRAYSISCGLLDAQGRLVRPAESPVLEFYISLIRNAAEPPALTPRLFRLHPGDRLYCGRRAHGRYGVQGVQPDDDVILAATGTGEAPHNAMLAELLSRGHRGRIVAVTCVRYRRDLGYLVQHRRIEQRFANYRYLTLTTRERENLDPSVSGYVGKRYLQDYFSSGEFERDAGCTLDPRRVHVFLCGSPDMIGISPPSQETPRSSARPPGMVQILEARGFQVDHPHSPGNLHFERFW